MVRQAEAAGIRPMVGLLPPIYAQGIPEPWLSVTDYRALSPVFAAYRAWLENFCRTSGVKTVDFAVPGLLPPEGARHYLDGLHPDREGHRLMAEAACAALPAPRI